MAKKVIAVIKLHIEAGKATMAPPVGPALAPHINAMEFVKAYNAQTADKAGYIIPAQVTVYADRSFAFTLKSPPASQLLKLAAGLEKGGGRTGRESVGQVTRAQVRQIAQQKMADLNVADLDIAARMIEGTARTMGIQVVEG